ncbi:MAG: hypothetical protein ACI8TX_001813 [Hyphomicrobiaceae bacterium]
MVSANPFPQSTSVLGERVNYDFEAGLVAGPGSSNGTLDFEIPADTPDGTVLTLQGEVSDAIGRTGGDSRQVVVRQPGIPGDDVVLFIDHTAASTVLVGGELRSTLVVDNAGRADATSVEAVLDGPASLTFVSSTPAPSTVDTIDGRTVIRWNLDTVAGPGNSRITVVHQVPASVNVGEELELAASASDLLGNTAADSVTVTVRD